MLSAYRVLDLTDDRGHFAGFILAMLGAEVIAVEPPGGGGARRRGPYLGGRSGTERSLSHLAYNRGKRSIELDLLRDGPDRDAFLGLVAGADVLIESFEPGAMAAAGIGPEALAAVNPSLVYCSITPFGSSGPMANVAATDITVAASAFGMRLNGDVDRPPVRLSEPQAFHFGAATAAPAIIIALQERARSGLGQHLDASAQAGMLLTSQGGVKSHWCRAPVPSRTSGGAQVGPLSLRFVYPATDGFISISHVFGTAIGPRTAALMEWVHEMGYCSAELAAKDWVRFAELVDLGEERAESLEEAKDAIAALTSTLTKDELTAIALERRLLIAPIATPQDVVRSEHFNGRGFFERVRPAAFEADAEPVPLPGVYYRRNGAPRPALGPAPRLDEHGALLRAEPPRRPSVATDRVALGEGPADRALSGLKVVDLTWSIAGPATVRVLADHGADVIKVESSTRLDAARGFMPVYDNVPGVEQSGLFDDVNLNKRSIALNLSKPEGREVLVDLIRWADVVVESFTPRAMPNWGLGYERLREINPSIIMLSTCLFGQDGPLSSLAGYGNLGAALSGFFSLAGWPDRSPAGPYLAYTDYTSNHLLLAALLAAVDHRRRTGEGSYLDVAQSEAAMHYLSTAFVEYACNGDVFDRMGNEDRELAPHGLYPAQGDDEWVAVACQDDDAWPGWCAVLGRADLAADPSLATAARRHARRAELDAVIAAWTAARPAEEAQAAFLAAGVAAQRLVDGPGALAHPQVVHRGHFVEFDHPHGRRLVEAARVVFSRTPARVDRSSPLLGEHTFEVLTDTLGYDGDRIAELAVAEVLE
ncbi:MAG: CoA transferase [Acidimicrobiales bacterium]|nr:CoA transferase [Acidimicrobiales bacterium]